MASAQAPSGPGLGPSHSHDDDDDDDDDHQPQNYFAGGERSGLSVQNPDAAPRGGSNNLVRDILKKAARSPASDPTAGSSSGSVFRGGGNTLGSDEVPSSFIPDPTARQRNEEEEEEVAVRNITFWRDGFSVEDGPLMRYDDPANQNLLNEINTG